MPRTRRRSGGKTPDHITKARLVEEIAALLHEEEGVTVERNVRLPSVSDPTRVQELQHAHHGRADRGVQVENVRSQQPQQVLAKQRPAYERLLGQAGLAPHGHAHAPLVAR